MKPVAVFVTILAVLVICAPPAMFAYLIQARNVPETKEADARMWVVESRTVNGRLLLILADKKTGVEYLSFDHGLTRLESTATK